MSSRRYEELTVRARRRVVTIALLRSAASVAFLVVLYYLAPLDAPLDAASWTLFGAGLLGCAALVAWQIRAVRASGTPRLRAIEAVAVGLPLLLLLFAGTYVSVGYNQPGAFSESLNHTDALYFTVTVFTTVGFGDIVPKTEIARVATTLQMLVGILAIGVVAKILLGAVQQAEQRGAGNPSDAASSAVDDAQAPPSADSGRDSAGKSS
jgi:voltage-gated potassium channel